MKKSMIPVSVAMLLATASTATLASSVTIPNVFVADTPAVAAEVNANFDDVATAVNDNDSRITTNTGNITTNTGNITTNSGAIATNAGNITTNATDIATNAGDITTNTADIATNAGDIATNAADIATLQADACPADMVAAGSICVDQYEASVWDAATGGTQLAPTGGINPGDANSFYRCATGGEDCGDSVANAATAIFARSVAGVTPASQVTWYQASQACANVGKRLPTTAEWQMAASGTPDGGDGVPDCNSDSIIDTLANTGATANCVSTVGANDMVGNLMEWAADIDTSVVSGASDTDSSLAWALGNSYRNNVAGLPTSTKALFVLSNGPIATNNQVGFRCVK